MNSDNKKRLPSEQLKAAMERYAEQDRLALQAIGFDWRSSPTVAYDGAERIPLDTPPPTLTITLRDDRVIKLREFYQYYVYAGVLAGYPAFSERLLIRAMESAARHSPHVGSAPVMLEPVFCTGTGTMKVDRDARPWPWVKLPDVCSIALFNSGPLSREDSDPYSSFVVIWFQDGYGLGNDARALKQLRGMGWESRAGDVSP